MTSTRAFLRLTVPLVVSMCAVSAARAAGAWNGQDLFHVPMSWCAVQGSPAQANPNIVGLNGVADTTTDAILWRRHERPTDNIYLNQAGITLRSAINNAWGSFNFPIITDTDTTNGTVGDVNGWNVNTDGAEFLALINACDQAYSDIGRAGIGVTAVNIGLFHDNANFANDMDSQMDYVTVIGWGGCNETVLGTCATPFDGRVMVVDNRYLYPTVADRTFPPSPADPGGSLQFTLTDPLDQLTGHEVGHSLSLDHRSSSTALMNPSSADNDNDGNTDNIALNSTEISALRLNALNVPGLETDPPGNFVAGDFVGMRLVDVNRDPNLAAHLDLLSVRAVLDRRQGRLYLSEELKGLLPATPALEPAYVLLLDLDASATTGCLPDELAKVGVSTRFAGADVVLRASVPTISAKGAKLEGGQVKQNVFRRSVRSGRGRAAQLNGPFSTEAFVCPQGIPIPFTTGDLRLELLTLRMKPHFASINDGRPLPGDFVAEVNHTIQFSLDNAALPDPVALDAPFLVQALTSEARTTRDLLDDGETGGQFVMELPSFPHCFPQADGVPGQTVPIRFDGLLPNTGIHALLGPDLVLSGVSTDANGEGMIDLPIPASATLGLHLVTIGHDAMALTADCTVNVVDCTATDTKPPEVISGSALPASLWPPNHRLVTVTIDVQAEDECDPSPACRIATVASNEPTNGPGDGNTDPDWLVTGDLTVRLRAERAGGGSGRVYTVGIECTDRAGNTQPTTVQISVPHDRRR